MLQGVAFFRISVRFLTQTGVGARLGGCHLAVLTIIPSSTVLFGFQRLYLDVLYCFGGTLHPTAPSIASPRAHLLVELHLLLLLLLVKLQN